MMAGLAGSKRPAASPFASPSKGATAITKRTRTTYNYYDEDDDDTASTSDERWSPDDLDSASGMSIDDEDFENEDVPRERTEVRLSCLRQTT